MSPDEYKEMRLSEFDRRINELKLDNKNIKTSIHAHRICAMGDISKKDMMFFSSWRDEMDIAIHKNNDEIKLIEEQKYKFLIEDSRVSEHEQFERDVIKNERVIQQKGRDFLSYIYKDDKKRYIQALKKNDRFKRKRLIERKRIIEEIKNLEEEQNERRSRLQGLINRRKSKSVDGEFKGFNIYNNLKLFDYDQRREIVELDEQIEFERQSGIDAKYELFQLKMTYEKIYGQEWDSDLVDDDSVYDFNIKDILKNDGEEIVNENNNKQEELNEVETEVELAQKHLEVLNEDEVRKELEHLIETSENSFMANRLKKLRNLEVDELRNSLSNSPLTRSKVLEERDEEVVEENTNDSRYDSIESW